ncbi:hypothetical protein C8J56DRAFT_927597 [Mycena floridula]|nr:hypothetical protein C8J56DRAFT_927597 [Mycena floridula]
MLPKSRAANSGQTFRPIHSRTSSASKVTQSTGLMPLAQINAGSDGGSNRGPGDAPKNRKKTVVEAARQSRLQSSAAINQGHRVHSRDQLPAYLPKRSAPPAPNQNKVSAAAKKGKAGFTLSAPGDEHDSDEGDWVSSESGATTPSQDASSSGDEDDAHTVDGDILTPVDHKLKMLGKDREKKRNPRASSAGRPPALVPTEQPSSSDLPSNGQKRPRQLTPVPRVATARQSDYDSLPSPLLQNGSRKAPPEAVRTVVQSQFLPEPSPDLPSPTRSPVKRATTRPPSLHSSTRPPSMYSTHSLKGDGPNLRPHPLIRGQSFGQPSINVIKPSPLAPLTDKSDVASSPPIMTPIRANLETSSVTSSPISGSPESINSPWRFQRRSSVSSARSVATLPVSSTGYPNAQATNSAATYHNRSTDRSRTLSTISASSVGSSSSAALSSLAQMAMHHQHRPSPAVASPHLTAFFPQRSHATGTIPIEKIHPLLPSPYMTNHLTVLANRTPMRESFDRVMRAKAALYKRD